jgi:hypothetical protein
MLHVFHEAYTETRRVLAGLAEPQAPYRALTEWIVNEPGGANVINVVYSMSAGRPCLTVVMERDPDVVKFAGGEPDSSETRQRILSRFREILVEQRNTKIVTDHISVVVTAFAPTARIEANHNVPPEAIFAFQHELAEPAIWLIKPHFEVLRVFFHTNDQLAASEHTGIRERITQSYQAVIAPYDEFGYVKEMPIEPVFDTRARFEGVYKGNWQGYDRDN